MHRQDDPLPRLDTAEPGRSATLPHGVALVTGLGAAIGLINAAINEWVSGWTVPLAFAILMFSPALSAAAVAMLSKMSSAEVRKVLMPYIWFGIGGCTVLALLALMSRARSGADGMFPRGSGLDRGARDVLFLSLLAVYFGVPVGVPLIRLTRSFRAHS